MVKKIKKLNKNKTWDLEEMNKEQLKLTFEYNNSFALSAIALGTAFFIASTTVEENTGRKLAWSGFLIGLTGFLLLKTIVRNTYLKLMEKLN